MFYENDRPDWYSVGDDDDDRQRPCKGEETTDRRQMAGGPEYSDDLAKGLQLETQFHLGNRASIDPAKAAVHSKMHQLCVERHMPASAVHENSVPRFWHRERR